MAQHTTRKKAEAGRSAAADSAGEQGARMTADSVKATGARGEASDMLETSEPEGGMPEASVPEASVAETSVAQTTSARAAAPGHAAYAEWAGQLEGSGDAPSSGAARQGREYYGRRDVSRLAREDLMEMEGLLCRQLATFFSFSGHALYFPRSQASDEPQLLARERKLLLPLIWKEQLLGMVMLHGVRAREVRPLLEILPAITGLILENLARAKAVRTDAVTGLATEESLFARMEGEAERVRAHLEEPSAPEGLAAPMHRMCMGIVLLRMNNGPDVVRRHGFAFAEKFMRKFADACRSVLPSDVLAARVGRHELALLLSASGRGACHKLARAVLARMEAERPVSPLTRQAVHARLCAGHALYPQDMQGAEMGLGMYEQARLLMARARLAADVAGQTAAAAEAAGADGTRAGESRIMPFARILQEGGLVLESLPLGRLRISLGRQAKAREGMRFAVWSTDTGQKPRYKGEVVLLRVGDRDSVAEILHLADAALLPMPGDSLALLGQSPVLSPDLDGHDPSLSIPGVQEALLTQPAAHARQKKHAAGSAGGPAGGSADGPAGGPMAPAVSPHATESDSADPADPADSAGGAGSIGSTGKVDGAAPAASAGNAAQEAAGDSGHRESAENSERPQSRAVPFPAVGDGGQAQASPFDENDEAGAASEDIPRCGLCGHGDFLNRFAHESERCARFVLAIVRLENAEGQAPATALRLWGKLLRKHAPHAEQTGPLAGLYGSNSLIFFHPGVETQDMAGLYQRLCADLKKEGFDAASGLAGFPFLQYRKAEMPDCALKALEYALLLPPPRVGLCNSLALNISADRRYSLGDVFGALEEYKLALLADKTNVMAWNSLGVCMAALGRGHEARRYFLEALRHNPDAGAAKQIYYNLGNICQSLGERRAAARYYRQCVKAAPDHLFAHIRLGQLCEQGGRRAEARRYYELAAAIEDASPGRPGVARRHLARVAARQRRGGEARELLHEALLRNPQDAASMLLLANIYLDGNEDPAVAELLARKSAGLHDRPEAWQTLARALRALDREDEARLAEARAVLG